MRDGFEQTASLDSSENIYGHIFFPQGAELLFVGRPVCSLSHYRPIYPDSVVVLLVVIVVVLLAVIVLAAAVVVVVVVVLVAVLLLLLLVVIV